MTRTVVKQGHPAGLGVATARRAPLWRSLTHSTASHRSGNHPARRRSHSPPPPAQWVDVSKGNWADYNAHGVSSAAANGAAPAAALNQTYGWGTESGSQHGDGGGWNSGVGNNSSDEQNYPYNAVAEKQQQLAAPAAAAAAAAAAHDADAKPSRPSLGHYYVCGTAMLLGALSATQVASARADRSLHRLGRLASSAVAALYCTVW